MPRGESEVRTSSEARHARPFGSPGPNTGAESPARPQTATDTAIAVTGRITDHRINFSSHQLAAVLDGQIDAFIEELATEDEANRLAEAGFDDE